MLLLGIDTSGKSGGVTLAEGDDRHFHALETTSIAGGMFSAQLVPTVAALLKKHGYAPQDVDGFVAVSGPGSFTGLRVGLSAVKGLAEVLHKPIATVSVLEVLAILSEVRDGMVAVALDAGRKELYWGLYETSAGRARMKAEKLIRQDELLRELEDAHARCLVTPSRAIAQMAEALRITVLEVPQPDSEPATRLGLQKLLSGETVSVEELDANYIRRSDAEIFSKGQE